jgi:tetratricopeptide (TPR) repeat protein
MQEGIGEYIRQARRQRNLTQTELGSDRFSKSYVSAVERNKITPSPDALKYFAEQLEQSEDYFTSMFLQADSSMSFAGVNETGLVGTRNRTNQDDELILLDTLLENTEFHSFPVNYKQLPMLSPDAIALLPPARQARYYFLLGLIAQENKNLATALHAFERALMLAPARHYPAILDELGSNYYLADAYQTALNYYLRALYSLKKSSSDDPVVPLMFRIELHCGRAYHALGAYHEACDYYESARTHLNSQQDMKSAGILYWGLGYCTYELLQQELMLADQSKANFTQEEIERQYQRAISFLIQSRSVYQVSGDRKGEITVRLTLALVLLDFTEWRRGLFSKRKDYVAKPHASSLNSLMQEAEEQCRQVLMLCQNTSNDTGKSIDRPDTAACIALAYLIRVYVERAAYSRQNGYIDTASRECTMGANLCQEALDSFFGDAILWSHLQNAISMDAERLIHRSPSLPRYPVQVTSAEKELLAPVARAEIFYAGGMVAEELGRAATSQSYASTCYARADQFYSAALEAIRTVIVSREGGPGYLIRCYQRCVAALEERAEVAPELYEETTNSLLSLLKNALYQLQMPLVPVAREDEIN